ncbi:MAG: endonuclease VIII [Defluviitaleaceae bacterium]|nr:endonuclease VIII [Defluviitaleaceae bacterium]
MIELPETCVLAEQAEQTLVGKVIKSAVAGFKPHAFALYSGDPSAYNAMLAGKAVTGAGVGAGQDCWGFITQIFCDDMALGISTPIKYHAPGEKPPKSHQLLVEFTDGSHISCNVQMWGSMFCEPAADLDDPERFPNRNLPSPLEDAFDEAYFDKLWQNVKPNISAKGFLATEQRIPGVGNGVVQDILFNACLHPKRKLDTMNDRDRGLMFDSVKTTLKQMRDEGGRDTEKDLFNQNGGYKTILSKKTLAMPCPICGGGLTRQAFLGGNIYFCGICQPL